MCGNDALLVDGMERDGLRVAQGETMIEFGPLSKNRIISHLLIHSAFKRTSLLQAARAKKLHSSRPHPSVSEQPSMLRLMCSEHLLGQQNLALFFFLARIFVQIPGMESSFFQFVSINMPNMPRVCHAC